MTEKPASALQSIINFVVLVLLTYPLLVINEFAVVAPMRIVGLKFVADFPVLLLLFLVYRKFSGKVGSVGTNRIVPLFSFITFCVAVISKSVIRELIIASMNESVDSAIYIGAILVVEVVITSIWLFLSLSKFQIPTVQRFVNNRYILGFVSFLGAVLLQQFPFIMLQVPLFSISRGSLTIAFCLLAAFWLPIRIHRSTVIDTICKLSIVPIIIGCHLFFILLAMGGGF